MTLKDEQDLRKVRPLPSERYEHEQLAALTVYSIYWLRQWGLRPTVETITVLNHRLFSTRFSMTTFPEHPDGNRTMRSLLQSGPKYRGWLSGSNRRGYAITPAGQQLVDGLLRRIGYPQIGDKQLGVAVEAPKHRAGRRANRTRDIDFAAEVERIRSSTLFKRWSAGSLADRDLIHVYSALGIFDHTPAAAKRQRLSDLKVSARQAEDHEVEEVLRTVEDLFPNMFRPA